MTPQLLRAVAARATALARQSKSALILQAPASMGERDAMGWHRVTAEQIIAEILCEEFSHHHDKE